MNSRNDSTYMLQMALLLALVTAALAPSLNAGPAAGLTSPGLSALIVAAAYGLLASWLLARPLMQLRQWWASIDRLAGPYA